MTPGGRDQGSGVGSSLRPGRFAATLALFFSVLSPVPCPLPAAPEKTIVYARGKDATKLDPADITDGESAKVVTQVFDTLVRFKEGSTEVEPALAESWSVSADGLEWTFRLREGALFHDGTPVDAAAAVFSFERQRDEKHPAHTGDFIYWHDLFASVAACGAADARTVRFRLKHPYAPFLANLAMFSASIVSPTAFAKDPKGFARNPVGSGPWIFERWERDSRIVLRANDKHWGGRPLADRLVIETIPDNTTRYLALKGGKVHLIDGLNPQHADLVRKDGSLRLHEGPGMNVAYLAFHNGKPPFDDPRVRQAVAHALDLGAVAKGIYLDLAIPASTLLPPTVWGRADALSPRAKDVARAKTLLSEAKVAPGTKVELSAFANPRPYMPEPQKLATHVKSCLKEIGLDCTIKMRDWAEHLTATQRGEHQMCLLGWNGDNGDPDNFLYVLLSKENTAPPASNVSFYKGEEASAFLAEAQRETDPAKRSAIYRKAQERIFADCPMVPLVHTRQMMASTKGLSGFALHPLGLVNLARAKLGTE